MPGGPGESLLTTLYADVHYYFADPTTKPQHHRFDRGSYVYLYSSPAQQTGKLEVANNAGTPDQDAISGYLNAARATYSHRHPCLVTLTVQPNSSLDHSQWHLPSWNEKNEAKYLYKLHTVDVYFWTEKDGATFLNHLKATMPADRLDVRDAPNTGLKAHSEHRDSMSPVVQQLENTAIGSAFPPRAESTTSAHSFPGPPTPATGVASPQPQRSSPAPMAYNPAAPAAPEPIAHREKTPPPPDAAYGTGLSAAEKHDSAPQYGLHQHPSGGYQPGIPTPGQSYFTGPPTAQPVQQTFSSSVPPPPPGGPPQQQQQQSYFSGPPQSSTSPAQRQSSTSSQPTQYASFGPQSSGFAPSVASPGLPPGTPGFQPQPSSQGFAPHQQQTQQGQQPQTFGYSNYSYNSQQQPSTAGDVHSQVYRPTEQEGAHGFGEKHKQTGWAQQQQAAQTQLQQSGYPPAGAQAGQDGGSKLQDRVGKVEKGVGKFLKKLDSKW